MPDVKLQLNELIRQISSDYYDPKHHGEGFVIIWDNKNRQTKLKKSIFSFMSGDRYEYYFVKSHTKPVMIRGVEFNWHEGTSNISLDFNASFQLKITSQEEAAKLVNLLAEVGQPDIGLHNLVDQYLYEVMTGIYQNYSDKKQNLLEEFYQHGLQKGESSQLNQKVSSLVAQQLRGSEFKIGFTLRNAPEHHIYYKHSTPIVKGTKNKASSNKVQDLNVESDCRLTLSNYQAYKKSGISGEEGLETYIEKSIDSAIRNNMLGKSTVELLSNFKNGSKGSKSIAQLVKEEVEQKATEIGYELESFHTLPDIAALQLLDGITIVFDENDEAIKVGQFGGKVRLNIRMSVKAIDGQFEKYKHLVADSGSDLVNIELQQIKEAIKAPIRSICIEVLRSHQQLDVLRDFDTKIREQLINSIRSNMEEQHGLIANINNLQPIESEDASRLEELRSKKHIIEFDFISNAETEDTAEITVTTAFHVVTLDFDSPNSWDAFERQDLGYRVSSPERDKTRENAPDHLLKSVDYDRAWKNIAIDDEIRSIRDEIIRTISNSNAFVIDLRLWLFDVKYKQKVEQQIIIEAKKSILDSRGLIIEIEPLITRDEALQSAQMQFRQQELDANSKKQAQRHSQELNRVNQAETLNQTIESALVNKTTDMIDNADDDDGIEKLIEIKNKTIETAHREEKPSKSSIADFVSSGRKPTQKQTILDDLVSQPQNTQTENGTGEKHED